MQHLSIYLQVYYMVICSLIGAYSPSIQHLSIYLRVYYMVICSLIGAYLLSIQHLSIYSTLIRNHAKAFLGISVDSYLSERITKIFKTVFCIMIQDN